MTIREKIRKIADMGMLFYFVFLYGNERGD